MGTQQWGQSWNGKSGKPIYSPAGKFQRLPYGCRIGERNAEDNSHEDGEKVEPDRVSDNALN